MQKKKPMNRGLQPIHKLQGQANVRPHLPLLKCSKDRSGVFVGAGTPTGRQLVLDMISKVARVLGSGNSAGKGDDVDPGRLRL